jgi:predicted 2-oxoglutarate/Fe(II)-dependent dioxygenase YbiX
MAIEVPFRFESEPLLWVVEDIYSQQECAQFIRLIERSSPRLATNNPLYRNQDRVMIDDPKTSEDLFRRLRSHLPEKMGNLRLIGLNERLRMYRYKIGQSFTPHMDHWYRPNDHQITLHTVLVYFNGNFEGGETIFQEQIEQIVIPKAGMVAIFQHKICHEGAVVRRGIKYAMRTEVIYGD